MKIACDWGTACITHKILANLYTKNKKILYDLLVTREFLRNNMQGMYTNNKPQIFRLT
jgi:hypothetical protein